MRKFLYDSRGNLERLLSTPNIPILRYADILLMYAEASNMANGGPTPEAVDAVNQVIDRANGHVDNPNYPKLTMSMTAQEFDAAVINERNYELCFEFDRWHDLVRKRILCDVVNPDVKVNCDDNDYLFPIPQADLRLNPLLDQNPGYPIP
ncbi:MAG: RagB/SusD family nutrient uptake outer membrane protein [Saprospiraceae bacterium]|nr:RagB/SusD family nutrient uptake outer membrane protein [Saprospiraceae bacterium]